MPTLLQYDAVLAFLQSLQEHALVPAPQERNATSLFGHRAAALGRTNRKLVFLRFGLLVGVVLVFFRAGGAGLSSTIGTSSFCIASGRPVLVRNSLRRRQLVGRAVPLDQADGGDLLATSSALMALSERDGRFGDLAEFSLVVPGRDDIPALADLLNEGFERFLSPHLMEGPLALPVNAFLMWSEGQYKNARLQQRLARVLSKPSLRRPNNAESIGVALMQRGHSIGPPAAYFELLLLSPDGRRPGPSAEEAADREAEARAVVEQAKEELTGETTLQMAKPLAEEAYLQFLCTAPSFRRRGLARAMAKLAEDIVARVWAKQRLYLHVDHDEAATKLVQSLGYERLGEPNLVHMCKKLDASIF